MNHTERITEALEIARCFGGVDGGHHKAYCIDQMVRCLTGCPMVKKTAKDCRGNPYEYEGYGESDEYRAWLKARCEGEDGPDTYGWDEGIAP